jgi:dTDP-4-dehydrorhamnose reductase
LVKLKFLVTGSAGLIGRQVVKDLSETHEVVSCHNKSKPEFGRSMKMDLLNHEMISNVLLETEPDVVIHLGAMTGVDLCEKEESMAFDVNTKATQIIAQQCSTLDTFLLYVSTDYVFDGNSGMYYEDSITNPLSIYGKSKFDGEKMVQNFSSDWCIARTSTPFGLHPTKKSFPIWIIENMQKQKQIDVLSDQFTSPTYVPNLSKMLIEISERHLNGIFHVAGATKISRYEMARMISDKLNLDEKLLRDVSINELKWEAQRPKDSSLNISKADSILDEKPQKINQSLDLFIDEIMTKSGTNF